MMSASGPDSAISEICLYVRFTLGSGRHPLRLFLPKSARSGSLGNRLFYRVAAPVLILVILRRRNWMTFPYSQDQAIGGTDDATRFYSPRRQRGRVAARGERPAASEDSTFRCTALGAPREARSIASINTSTPYFAAKIGGKLFHRLLPAGRQYEIDFLRRQQIRKFNTEATRCACDQRPFSGEAVHCFNGCAGISRYRGDRLFRHRSLHGLIPCGT